MNWLTTIYLERREALVRFFTARLGSAAAAEDLVQDIYVKLSSLEDTGDVQNEVAFVYRLGSNLMLDKLRQERRSAARDGHWRESTIASVQGEDIADEPWADEALASRQRLGRLIQAVQSLPESQRDAFRFHKLEGLSQAETAARMGVSVSSVEKYIRAALRHLADTLG